MIITAVGTVKHSSFCHVSLNVLQALDYKDEMKKTPLKIPLY